jgi:hypothetical protein
MADSKEPMDEKDRVEYLFQLLKPCQKKSRNPDWSTLRYMTEWGSKIEEGLKAVIMRVVYSKEHLPKLE